MKTLHKAITLMGGKHSIGGVAMVAEHVLAICYNSINRIVVMNLTTDTINMSMQAVAFADYCEVESMTYINHSSVAQGLLLLLKNGEVWHKSLSDMAETKWGTLTIPECRGATAIEYFDGALYAAFAKDNKFRKLTLQTLNTISSYTAGVRGGSADPSFYAPEALAYDPVLGSFVSVDPVKGELIWMTAVDFIETAYERYVYHVYNTFFKGDLAMGLSNLPGVGEPYFAISFGTELGIYSNPWYQLYEINDLSGQITAVSAPTFNDTPAGYELVKHFRIVNTSAILRQGVTISVANDLEHNVDEALTVSATGGAGTWDRSCLLGDIAGGGHTDFWMRFYPQTTTEIGTFAVEIIIDYA